MFTASPRVLMLTFGLLLAPAAASAMEMTDDFASYANRADPAPRWDTDSILWEARDGALLANALNGTFALLNEPTLYRRIAVEATVQVDAAVSESWKVAAVAVYASKENFWHFALVESPDKQKAFHFLELTEMRGGNWLSQSNLKCTRSENMQLNWQTGKRYRLRIAMTPKGVEGTLSDLAGKALARMAFAFNAPAVTSGRAGLRCSGFRARYDDVQVNASEPLPPVAAAKPARIKFAVAAHGEPVSKATGFYRTEKRGDAWWVIDPTGRLFYAVGTDHCNYRVHWCEKLGYAPYHRNVAKKFGSSEAWAKSATDRLKAWGFNLLGAGNGAETRCRGLAHTLFASLGSSFSPISDLCPKVHWTGFPNVFHPKFAVYCDKRARALCRANADDPWLFGYFLDNELEWYGKSHTEWGLFDEVAKKPADHSGKQELVRWLRQRYQSAAAFAKAWGADFKSWDDVARRDALVGRNADTVKADKLDFVRHIAEAYFRITTAAIRKHDPNHMILGCRFAARAPADIWDIAGRYCDIVSFNYYGRVDLETGDAPGLAERYTSYYELAKKPMMVTEWSFPALDSGLPCMHGAGQRFDTQTQRAQAFAIHQTLLFSLPFMVGSDFFMWADEPALGISSTFPEDTNYGLVNEQDAPYPELTLTAARLNPRAYDIHGAGCADLAAAGLSWDDGQVAATVRNTGTRNAATKVRIALDGKRVDRDVTVAAKASATVRLPWQPGPGGHQIALSVDPDRTTTDITRADNATTTAFYCPGARWPTGATRRTPIVVFNPTAQTMPERVVAAPMPDAKRPISLVDAAGRPVASQLDLPPRGSAMAAELCFVAPKLAPGECRTFFAYPQLPAPSEAKCDVKVDALELGYRLDNGSLRLEKTEPDGDFADIISLDDVALGRYNPLVWQTAGGQQMWTKADKLVSCKIKHGPVRVVLDLCARGGEAKAITAVDKQGKQAAQRSTPVAFEVRHRVYVAPRQPWFAARLASIKNVADRPLTLRGYFFYLNSSIGGSAQDDAPGSPQGVPNYYASTRGLWHDAAVGACLGAASIDDRLKINFWLDKAGGQHPDARRELAEPVVLAPGKTYTESDARLVIVFAAKGDLPACRAARTAALAMPEVRCFAEERR